MWQVAAGRRTCEHVAHAMAFVHRGKQSQHIFVVAAPENDLRQVARKEGLLRVACSQQHLPICMQHVLVCAVSSQLSEPCCKGAWTQSFDQARRKSKPLAAGSAGG